MGDAYRTSAVDSIQSPRAQGAARRRPQLFRSRSTILLAVAFAISTVAAASAQSAAGGPSADPPPPADPGQQGGAAATPSSPLAIHVGDSDFLIGGFMDATAIMRSTNPGTGIGTLVRDDSVHHDADRRAESGGEPERDEILGAELAPHAPGDEQGRQRQPQGLPRSRLPRQHVHQPQRHEQLQRRSACGSTGRSSRSGKFEFLAGQSWSLMTPGRNGHLAGARRPLLQPGRGHELPEWPHLGPHAGLPLRRARQRRCHGRLRARKSRAVRRAARSCCRRVPGGGGGHRLQQRSARRAPCRTCIRTSSARSPSTRRPASTHQHIDAAILIRGFKTFNPATSATASATGTGGSVNVVLEAGEERSA